jgi:hypothetical protein
VSSIERVGEQVGAVWKSVRRRPFSGQRVQVRRGNFAAEGAEVGEAQVVGQDHQKVGALRHRYAPR